MSTTYDYYYYDTYGTSTSYGDYYYYYSSSTETSVAGSECEFQMPYEMFIQSIQDLVKFALRSQLHLPSVGLLSFLCWSVPYKFLYNMIDCLNLINSQPLQNCLLLRKTPCVSRELIDIIFLPSSDLWFLHFLSFTNRCAFRCGLSKLLLPLHNCHTGRHCAPGVWWHWGPGHIDRVIVEEVELSFCGNRSLSWIRRSRQSWRRSVTVVVYYWASSLE